jgi:hypothetical protein
MIPEKFYSIIQDFIRDLTVTFPELLDITYISEMVTKPKEEVETHIQMIYDHIVKETPLMFGEIINEADTLFTKPCLFLPEVDFSKLWNDRVSESTKSIIWKYFKLIIISLIDNMGNISQMFTEEKLKQMVDEMSGEDKKEEFSDKFKGLISGKIGALAQEIAAETVGENPDEDTLKNMMKSPENISNLVSTVGDKISNKIKSGELKESELLQEATEMLTKLKDMPGMSQFESMFSNLGKMNVNAMQSKMGQEIKKAKTKERLREKLENRKNQK